MQFFRFRKHPTEAARRALLDAPGAIRRTTVYRQGAVCVVVLVSTCRRFGCVALCGLVPRTFLTKLKLFSPAATEHTTAANAAVLLDGRHPEQGKARVRRSRRTGFSPRGRSRSRTAAGARGRRGALTASSSSAVRVAAENRDRAALLVALRHSQGDAEGSGCAPVPFPPEPGPVVDHGVRAMAAK